MKNDGSIDTTTYLSSLPSHNHDDRYYTESEVDTALNSKQDTLISGTNIKTINNTSLLGTGNINIQGGGSITIDSTWITGSTNPVESQLVQSALSGKADNEDIPTNLSDLNNDEGFVTQYHTHSIEDTDLFSVLDCVNDNFDDLSDGNYIIILGSD